MTFAPAFALLALSLSAAERKIELPPETAAFKPGPGAELATARCLVCHSADYVSTQPPMPKGFWKAGIQKMRDKYGAELPDEELEPLISYLASVYGTEKADGAPKASPRLSGTGSADGPKLAERYRCLGCHSVERRRTGPAFKSIAAKYASRADGPAKVARQIHRGGAGQWGTIAMPPFKDMPKSDVKTLADWILSLR